MSAVYRHSPDKTEDQMAPYQCAISSPKDYIGYNIREKLDLKDQMLTQVLQKVGCLVCCICIKPHNNI